jgi:hypothetical protein
VRIVVFEALEADQLGVFARQRFAVRHFVGKTEQEVLAHGEPREYRALLRDEDSLAVGLQPRLAVDQHRARIRLQEPDDDVHQRGLAASGRPDNGDEFAVAHVEAQVADHLEALPVLVEGLAHVLQRDLGASHFLALAGRDCLTLNEHNATSLLSCSRAFA